MNINELYSLYKYISDRLEEINSDYEVYEPAVLELYGKILEGKVGRKDFLIFAIRDMIDYIKENNIEGVKSTLMIKFNRVYGNK